MASTAESGSSDVLRSERIAGGILPKVLNTFDMVAIFVAIVLFISNSAVMAGGMARPHTSTGAWVSSRSSSLAPS